jgi:pyruvate dehydrogenase kinase 2/3/4
MKTGRGELLPKTYKDYEHDPQSENCKLATNKILMQVAGFLRHELPIRLSHRILDLDRVPLMKEMSSVKQVRDLYVTSFLELLSVKKRIESVQQEQAFAEILDSVYERHASVLVQMARGAFELRAAIKKGNLPTTTIKQSMVQFDSMEDMHAFLDRFYVSRIG